MRRIVLTVVLLLAVVAGAAWAYGESMEPGWWLRLRYPLEYENIVLGHAENYDLDPALIAAVIYRESRFDPDAVSESGAVGLMQLLPDTAEGIAELTGGTAFRSDDLYEPELNVRYGAFYLRRLLTKYDGDLELALAAYHAGQGNVDEWRRSGGRIEFPETRAYVQDVLDLRETYRKAYGQLRGGETLGAERLPQRA
jgi:soluble lytic murein transglycosylase